MDRRRGIFEYPEDDDQVEEEGEGEITTRRHALSGVNGHENVVGRSKGTPHVMPSSSLTTTENTTTGATYTFPATNDSHNDENNERRPMMTMSPGERDVEEEGIGEHQPRPGLKAFLKDVGFLAWLGFGLFFAITIGILRQKVTNIGPILLIYGMPVSLLEIGFGDE